MRENEQIFKVGFLQIFPPKRKNPQKNFFSKVTSMDNIQSLIYKIFCHAPPSGHNLQNQNPGATFEYLLQSDQELPISRNPRVFCYPCYARRRKQKPLDQDIEAAVVYFLSL